MRVWVPMPDAWERLGEMPPDTVLEVWAGNSPPPDSVADVEFWAPPFLAGPEVLDVLPKMTGLRVIQLFTAGADVWVGRLPEGVTLCDGRGIHTSSTSEWVVGAILAAVREFPLFAWAQRERRWAYRTTDRLEGKRVLVIGAGDIGQAVCRRLAPFEVDLVKAARRPRPGVHGMAELPDLLPRADIVVLVVPLTTQSRGMVDATFLSRLHDGALLVNASRGPVVVTEALVAELASGRLRAALDVTDPEPLPADHPLWTVPGLLLTPHVAGSVTGIFPRAYRLLADQLRRYANGQPLENVVVDGY